MSTEGGTPEHAVRRYWAFISYSHADKAFSNWLFHAIENYRVPRGLVGKQGRDGPIPRRLIPIFRDRDELPVSTDLGANIKLSLANSKYLIVICSPRAALSRWVNQEVCTFKATRGEDRSLCLLVDGEPNASDNPATATQECMPEAVRYRVAPDGSLTDIRVEPIAADIRPDKDGRSRARLKIIAGMLGVNFDDLWQREQRRRTLRQIGVTLGACAVIAAAYLLYRWEEHRSAILQEIALGEQQAKESHRLDAAVDYAAAWQAGGRGTRIEADLKDAARALIEPSAILKGGTNWLTSAAFIGTGQVVTTGWDHTVRVWNLTPQLSSRVIATEAATVSDVAFSPKSSDFSVADWDGALHLYHPDSPTPLDLIPPSAQKGRLNWVAFSPDGRRLVCACDDGSAKVFDIPPAGSPPSTAAPLDIAGHDNYVKTAEFSPDGNSILTASFDATAKLWDAHTGKRMRTLVPESAWVNAAVFSPDGRTVATACLDGNVLIWDITVAGNQPQKIVRTIPVHAGLRVNSVAFSPDGSQLATACDDHTADIWNVATGDLLLSYEGHKDIVVCVAFSPDGKQLVSAGKEGFAAIIPTQPQNLASDQIVALTKRLEGPLPALP